MNRLLSALTHHWSPASTPEGVKNHKGIELFSNRKGAAEKLLNSLNSVSVRARAPQTKATVRNAAPEVSDRSIKQDNCSHRVRFSHAPIEIDTQKKIPSDTSVSDDAKITAPSTAKQTVDHKEIRDPIQKAFAHYLKESDIKNQSEDEWQALTTRYATIDSQIAGLFSRTSLDAHTPTELRLILKDVSEIRGSIGNLKQLVSSKDNFPDADNVIHACDQVLQKNHQVMEQLVAAMKMATNRQS